jgi:predicted Zn-ribbon and HTH transcriptional regulator
MKCGAWVRCESCGFTPSTSTEQAKSLIATDHYFPLDFLHGAAQRIKEGRPLGFPEDQVSLLAKDIERQQYFLLNFDPVSGCVPCMKCGRSFAADDEKEQLLCPECTLKDRERESGGP